MEKNNLVVDFPKTFPKICYVSQKMCLLVDRQAFDFCFGNSSEDNICITEINLVLSRLGSQCFWIRTVEFHRLALEYVCCWRIWKVYSFAFYYFLCSSEMLIWSSVLRRVDVDRDWLIELTELDYLKKVWGCTSFLYDI